MNHPTIKEWTAIALLAAGVAMAFVALFLPPSGEIDESVLYFFAQILIYAGTVFGLDHYISLKVKKMNIKR